MHIGPKLQEDILVIVIRWAFPRFVFTSDIVMFRQFLVNRDGIDWQRIVWRRSSEEPINIFRLVTVTYGTACAPFLANACMIQLADDEAQRFPIGAEVLRKNHYADDFFAGEETIEEVIEIRNQLINIFNLAGMQAGKWASNNSEILKD